MTMEEHPEERFYGISTMLTEALQRLLAGSSFTSPIRLVKIGTGGRNERNGRLHFLNVVLTATSLKSKWL